MQIDVCALVGVLIKSNFDNLKSTIYFPPNLSL